MSRVNLFHRMPALTLSPSFFSSFPPFIPPCVGVQSRPSSEASRLSFFLVLLSSLSFFHLPMSKRVPFRSFFSPSPFLSSLLLFFSFFFPRSGVTFLAAGLCWCGLRSYTAAFFSSFFSFLLSAEPTVGCRVGCTVFFSLSFFFFSFPPH